MRNMTATTTYQNVKFGRKIDSYLKRLAEEYPEDGDLITAYIFEKSTIGTIRDARKYSILQSLYIIRNSISPCGYAEISKPVLYRIIAGIKDRYKPNSQRLYLVTLKTFMAYLVENKLNTKLTMDIIQSIKAPQQNYETHTADDILSDAEIYKMIQTPSMNARNAALITLSYWIGCRPSEALRLRWKDINFERDYMEVIINDTKTKKQRYVPVYDRKPIECMITWLRQYPRELRTDDNSNYIFINLKGMTKYYTITPAGFCKIISKAAEEAGIKKIITPYSCRRSNITHQAEKGIPESVIKEEHWGNQSSTMLRSYVFVSKNEIKRHERIAAGLPDEEERPEQQYSAICSQCLCVNAAGDSYCRKCGAPLNEVSRQNSNSLRNMVDAEHVGIEDIIKVIADYCDVSRTEVRRRLELRR